MTLGEYQVRRNKYIEKAEYYRRKVEKLDQEYFEELNKDCRFFKHLNEICEEVQNESI